MHYAQFTLEIRKIILKHDHFIMLSQCKKLNTKIIRISIATMSKSSNLCIKH